MRSASKATSIRTPSVGVAVAASVASYRFYDDLPLGHASFNAVVPAVRELGFAVHSCRDKEFSRPDWCQRVTRSLSEQTRSLILFVSSRAAIHDRTPYVLHPHSRPRRRPTHIPLPQLIDEVRKIWAGPMLVLASLHLDEDVQLVQLQQITLDPTVDVDVVIICVGSEAGVPQLRSRTGPR